MHIQITASRHKPIAMTALLTSSLLAACSGGSSNTPSPTIPQNSTVAVMLTSTGNDSLSQLEVTATDLILTTQSGQQVDLIATPQQMEFSHLNGALEPLLTASLPQGTYISATIVLSRSTFACDQLTSSGGVMNYEYLGLYTTTVPVTLSAPIRISGKGSGLLLDMDANASAHAPDCVGVPSSSPFSMSMTPAFQLRTLSPSETPTSSASGLANNLQGVIASIDPTNQTVDVTNPFGRTWTASIDGATAFKGIAGLADAAPGMAVEMDVAIHADGTLQARRVAVVDADSTSLSTFGAELVSVFGSISNVAIGSTVTQGAFASAFDVNATPVYLDTSATVYRISSRFDNIQNLPFVAAFDAGSMVPGQRIYASNHSWSNTCCVRDPATTLTLEPQTIDGKVVQTSTAGNFTTYTVELASYDRFASLLSQPGQTVSLALPGYITVYVDANAQVSTTAPIAIGQTLRFNGLVFNDNGNLRMDCGEVLDGTPL